MSINPVSQPTVAKVASQAAVTDTDKTQPAAKKPTPAKTQPAATDTVTISSAAQAALQEATETSTQTAQEAAKGDHQAQRLLVKEAAAAKAALEGSK